MVDTRRFTEVDVDGGELAVWCHNPRGIRNAPFLLLHDAAANARVWDPVMSRLPPGVTAFAPDLRGRGASAQLGGPWGVAASVDDLVRVVEHFDLDSVGVVALGTSTALAYALEVEAPGLVAVSIAVTAHEIEGGVSRVDPFVANVSSLFHDRPSYHQFWRQHEAFAGQGCWNSAVEDFLDHGFDASPGVQRSKAHPEAVLADIESWSAAQLPAFDRLIELRDSSTSLADAQLETAGLGGKVVVRGISPTSAVLCPVGADAVAGVVSSFVNSQE